MRPRDLTRLESTEHDVLVVGGGIQGLTIAYEAASRGLSVALVEAGDFGGGTSFNHQKTAHGGLRALSTGQIGRARESIRERRALARIAPWFLRPLPFIIGTYRSVVKNRLAMMAAFKVDAWFGRRRNDGVEPELHLPPARLVSKAATIGLFAGVKRDKLTGGAQWYDYQMVESDRLTIAFAAAAAKAGADLANYVEALEPLREGARIGGMTVRDRLSGRIFPVRVRLTINAAGARAGEIMERFGVRKPFPLVKAMNLVTTKRASDIALAAPTTGGRMLTLTPWRGRAVVGTSQSARTVEPGDTRVTAEEVDAFIREANDAFPALQVTRADVTLVHCGVVPAVASSAGVPDLKPSPEIFDHAAEGIGGAMTVVGVKYTTARGVAERVVHKAAKRLGKSVSASRTAVTVLPGAGIADHEALAIETARALNLDVPLTTIAHLITLYAESAASIVRLMAERPELREPVAPGVATVGAEVVHAIGMEMAMTLSDIVIRRTALGSAGMPGRDAIAGCARIAAPQLGWDAARVEREMREVEEFYSIEP
jgi:glycerol-3-phosphate dehydrogenase